MGLAIDIATRNLIIEQRKRGHSFIKISSDLKVGYTTVRNIWQRYLIKGEAGLVPDYKNCGKASIESNMTFYRGSLWLKRLHPQWGAPLILLKLKQRYGVEEAPSARTLQRWFRNSQLNTPRQRKNNPKIGRSKATHNIWQVDAKEQMTIANGEKICYLTIVDEHSGAWLEAPVFPLSSNFSSSTTNDSGKNDCCFYEMGLPQSFASRQW